MFRAGDETRRLGILRISRKGICLAIANNIVGAAIRRPKCRDFENLSMMGAVAEARSLGARGAPRKELPPSSRRQARVHRTLAFNDSSLSSFQNKKTDAQASVFLFWSGRRGSNSLPPPWQGGALPDELRPQRTK